MITSKREIQMSKIECTCSNCGKHFLKKPSELTKKNYCSRECYFSTLSGKGNPNWKGIEQITRNCELCGKSFNPSIYNVREGNGRFCSKDCAGKSRKKPMIASERKCKSTKIFVTQCVVCSKWFSSRRKKKTCSKECKSKLISIISSSRNIHGENNPNWRNGSTDEMIKIRTSSEYSEVRKKVFERDAYTCRKCGKVGNKLNAHHIIPASADKSLILELDNMITLCVSCHKKEHIKQKSNNQIDIFNVRYRRTK